MLEWCAPSLASHKTASGRFDLPVHHALAALAGAAAGLAFIHECDLVHNDIRPCNILYDVHFGAVLCDFSLCADKTPSKYELIPCYDTSDGAPWYLAPEFV